MEREVLERLREEKLRPRDVYLARLVEFQDTEFIKIVTGIRRCGKSSVMKLMIRHLLESGIDEKQIIYMRFESLAFGNMDMMQFYEYVKSHAISGRRMYLFFDEPQVVDGWERVLNSFRVDMDCDIYVTGSNAYMLSSEYATYLSGRYVEIHMYPLSFREFIDFYGFHLEKRRTLLGEAKWQAGDENGNAVDLEEIFDFYSMYGGMPGLVDAHFQRDKVVTILDGIYSTVVMRDILERPLRKGLTKIANPFLLKKIIAFMADTVGNSISLTSIGNALVSNQLLENRSKQGRTAVSTVSAYVSAICQAYLFYEAKRFDVRGKEELKTLGKYYIVDPGLRSYLLSYRKGDTGHLLENVIYFELLRRGYDVAIGKAGNKEIDFIATKQGKSRYFQVTEQMDNESTRERELAPLLLVQDNYEKHILVRRKGAEDDIRGIHIVGVIDFLLQENV